MRLFLIRHARTAWNAELRAQGHTDIPLDPEGERQVELLGEHFSNVPIGRILSSDLARAVKTAEAISVRTGVSIEYEPLLRERAYGDWEGLKFEEFHDTVEDMTQRHGIGPFDVRPPGGESLNDTWRRINPIVDNLLKSEEPTVVVSHGGICAILLSRLIKGTIETSRAFRFDNSGVTELVRRPEGSLRLMRFNDTSHLQIENDATLV